MEQLIVDLQSFGALNLREKLCEADNLDKFYSIVAELDAARFLSRFGKRIEFIVDGLWKGPSPDMLVRDGNRELYVEVKRVSEDDTISDLRKELDKFLPRLTTPIRVDLRLKGELLAPATERPSRLRKARLAKESLDLFKEAIQAANLANLPETISTPQINYDLLPISQAKGFCGTIGSDGVFTPDEPEIIKKLQSDLREKARKRSAWKGSRRTRPYLIALVSELTWLDSATINAAFTGHIIYAPMENDFSILPINRKVEVARSLGWESFLLEIGLIPNRERKIFVKTGDEGCLLTDERLADVSGVLIIVQWTGRYYFVPNPFATAEINAPWLTSFIPPTAW
jgi:hypothetical protein